jgi:hypothetical protein
MVQSFSRNERLKENKKSRREKDNIEGFNFGDLKQIERHF